MLKQISPEAWAIVAATTTLPFVAGADNDVVAENATTVAKPIFNEGILRPILDLLPSQQLTLVQALVKTGDKKASRQQAV